MKLKNWEFQKEYIFIIIIITTTTGGLIYGENTCTIFEFPTAITM
jgi:hypothetical protein